MNYKMTKCEKCGYDSEKNKSKFGLVLCNVCYALSPNNPEELDKYVQEKVNQDALKSFRKYVKNPGEQQKKGMIKKATNGFSMSRAPFGYTYKNSELIPAQNSEEVFEIFDEFVNSNISLRKLSKKHNLSVNGLKKILRNFAYIGKVRFNNQIFDAKHKPLISTTLFNHAQNKLDKIEKKK